MHVTTIPSSVDSLEKLHAFLEGRGDGVIRLQDGAPLAGLLTSEPYESPGPHSYALNGVAVEIVAGNEGRQELVTHREGRSGDEVNHPPHYNLHPSGVECIDIVEHMSFPLGNVIKYVWRADFKTSDPLVDLKKAQFYLNREISRREAEGTDG